MSGSPPAWLDRSVASLIPPGKRDEVMGDLWERYRSPSSFVSDAMRVIPWLVVSQVRRAIDPALFLVLGFIVLAALGGLEPQRLSLEVPIAWRAVFAATAALAVLALRDVYRLDDRWTTRRVMGDTAWLVGGIGLSQALVWAGAATGAMSHQWALPTGWVAGGSLFAALAFLLLRSEAELVRSYRKSARAGPDQALVELRSAIQVLSRARALALLVTAVAAAIFALSARPIVAAAAELVAIGALALFAQAQLRGASHDSLIELQRQHAARISMHWWIAAPVLAGIIFNVVAFGWATQHAATFSLGVGACVALVLMMAGLAEERRRCLGQWIALLRS